MKRFSLTVAIVIAALSTVACGDDKKKASQQEMIHACLWDQTGNCQKQVAAYASSPAVLPIANNILAQNPGILNGVGAGASAPVVLAPGTGNGVAIRTASNNAVLAQAQKVAAAIKADSMNPSSIHYDPPQASRGPASASPASIAPSSVSDAPAASGGSFAGSGDATR